MSYSITLRSFSATFILAFCCQLIESAPSTNPESDVNCIPVKSVTKDDRSWDSTDRVFICHLSQNRFEIHSYGKHERIVFFNSSDVVFREQWARTIRFTVNGATSSSQLTCTFSHIEHAQAFYARVNPHSKLSPQNFTLRRLESCFLLDGKCQNRKKVTSDPLVFHQHFIDSRRTKFTFEAANGSMAGGIPPLIFLKGEFQVYSPATKVILANRGNSSLYYVLYFRDYETTEKFFDYVLLFIDIESVYPFPAELRQ